MTTASRDCLPARCVNPAPPALPRDVHLTRHDHSGHDHSGHDHSGLQAMLFQEHGLESPLEWFDAFAPEKQSDIARFVKSIEEDTDGWNDETRCDLANEFELTADRATAVFRRLCTSQESKRRLAVEDAAAAARGTAAAAAAAGAREREDQERALRRDWLLWPAAKAASDELGGEVIRQLDVRACPHCSAPVEKNGGCDHMVCRVCRKDFWWGRAIRTLRDDWGM
eukprot:Transcript_27751.p1 GENE.Transcript_27751~~Transcript_27751.p1  ORF type:complete len:243 (+),score=32.20 Transcript_27751:56-730(+)